MSLHDELHEQPDTLDRLLTDGIADTRAVATRLTGADVTHVVLAARGTSDNAARYAQYVWGELAGTSVGLAAPSLFAPDTPTVRLDGAAVIVLSQSGQSPDLLTVARAGVAQQRPVVAITNDTGSPLADIADLVVDLRAGPEAAAEALEAPAATMVLGRGWHLASAYEWALKLQELSGIVAQAWSTADAEHGPVAAIGEHTPLLAVSTSGDRTHAHTCELLERLARDRGAPVVMASDHAGGVGLHLPLPRAPAAWLAPIAAAPVLQRMAIATARARGRDPDNPRGLDKVTRTR